jgi:hypothetical protein
MLLVGNKARDFGWSKKLAAVAMAGLLSLGMAGCKLGEEKADSSGTDGSSGGGTVTPPSGGGGTTTNRAPTISGSPVTTAKISLPYSFQPVASDPDRDPLTFEIRSKPTWASFDTKTGRLYGTPPAGSTGTFTGVQIVVSDSKTTTALPAFSINVVEPLIGSAELAWQPPTTNEDGTALQDLSGYVIRYGKSAGALDKSVRINSPGTTMYVVENLIEGTWYFSLSSVNSAGVESRPTGYVSKTI